MKKFGGLVLFLDRSDINTDEIIPAKYLTEVTKKALKHSLLEDLKLDGFEPASERVVNARVIVTRSNFGCGSSREHAVWVLEANGINVVIAQSFARIFRQNMFNCGMLAIELPKDTIQRVFQSATTDGIECSVHLKEKRLCFLLNNNTIFEYDFVLGEFDEELVKSGGWVGYADKQY